MFKRNVSWLLLAMANHVPRKGTSHSLPSIPLSALQLLQPGVDDEFSGL